MKLREMIVPGLIEAVQDKLDKLKQAYVAKNIAKFEKAAAPHPVPQGLYTAYERTFDKLVQADPSQQKKYLSWLMNWANNGGKMEDLPKAHEYLDILDRGRVRGFDLNSVKTLPELFRVVEPFLAKPTQGQEEKEQRAQVDTVTKYVYQGPEGMILIPTTEGASQFWGRGTQWCTAATKGQCLYSEYAGRGPLYVVIPKGSAERFQLHFETGQFMDATDTPLELPEFQANQGWVFDHLRFNTERTLKMLKNIREANDDGHIGEIEEVYPWVLAFSDIAPDEMAKLYEQHPDMLQEPSKISPDVLLEIIKGVIKFANSGDELMRLVGRIFISGSMTQEIIEYLLDKDPSALGNQLSRIKNKSTYNTFTPDQYERMVARDPQLITRISDEFITPKMVDYALARGVGWWTLAPFMSSGNYADLILQTRHHHDGHDAISRLLSAWIGWFEQRNKRMDPKRPITAKDSPYYVIPKLIEQGLMELADLPEEHWHDFQHVLDQNKEDRAALGLEESIHLAPLVRLSIDQLRTLEGFDPIVLSDPSRARILVEGTGADWDQIMITAKARNLAPAVVLESSSGLSLFRGEAALLASLALGRLPEVKLVQA